ncbi:Thioredoxin-like [Spirosomataceae bacterium TFI 002]|nr:Thioredoxin-like [Spirosomataceae bacterium TFI 002]
MKIIHVIISFAFISCHDLKKAENQILSEEIVENSSIVCNFDPKREGAVYYDPYYDRLIIQPNDTFNIKSFEKNVFIEFGSGDYTSYYILKPRLFTRFESSENFLKPIGLDEKQSRELGFYEAYKKRFGNIDNEEFLAIRSLWGKKYIEKPELRDEQFEEDLTRQLLFLDEYTKDHHLDEDFLLVWTNFFKYRKYEKLVFLQPMVFDQIGDEYVNSVCHLVDTIQNDDLLYLRPYQNTLLSLAYTIWLKEKGNDSQPEFESRLKSIGKHFKGKSLDFLKMTLIKSQILESRLTFNQIKPFYEKFISTCPHEDYKNNIKDFFVKDTNVEAGAFVDINQEAVDLKQLIKNNKLTYVDFWASWCKPCIEEFRHKNELASLFKGKGVGFVFLSIDQDYDKWKSSSLRLLKGENSFFEMNSDSTLSKQLAVKEIPRYVIFDQSGNPIVQTALRPSDPKLKVQLNELLKRY